MYIVDEKDREYRFGDSGPKYLMKGPRMNFALVQFMPGQDFKAHYHLRWQEENSFRDLKYSLCLKAFHSKKYDYIVQEVWARVILYNFSSSIIINVTVDREDRAYEYQANYSSALKTCRYFLRIHDGITKINVESLIAQNIEPIRPGRTFARQHRFKLPMSFCYRH